MLVDHAGADARPQDSMERFAEYRSTCDRAIRNELVLRYDWLAQACARRFADRGEPWADLVQVAQLGVVKAVERFDPARGVSFPTYAVPTVVGELKRHVRDATWSVSVPRRCKELLTRMNAANESLHQRLGRAPTVDEIAEVLGVDRDLVLETIEANQAYRSVSLEQPRPQSGGDSDRPRSEVLGGDDERLDTTEARMSAVRALGVLDERMRKIVYWRFFEECTQREIGRRLGIGQVQVSRLLRAALAELRKALGADLSELIADDVEQPAC